ncbi:hypothetical protein [Natronolimnohabitans innermongolicus]|uniref:Uncharacterized protein n=1 Tax=Natronolimnohabitans innermongolicus JCM 12255 TaxID=1227499 RepID=L9WLQ2_9EURY|nr:hypothetical protein [Natronolimnohabitans innermongolicus]ELY50394.1 hypothetical protein C493_18941 [Natronolimnohabitans innermongolicus JCM 12255]
MPHLQPAQVLEQFASFLQEDVRAEIDDEFVDGQVGSMSSTMRYLSQELRHRDEVTSRQRASLLEGLEAVDGRCDETAVVESAADARDRIENASANSNELETVLVSACNDVLETIDAELEGDAARAAREPLYDYLRVRVEGQLEMLGRDRT